MTPGTADPQARPSRSVPELVRRRAYGLIALQFVVRGYITFPSYFFQDDFAHLDLAALGGRMRSRHTLGAGGAGKGSRVSQELASGQPWAATLSRSVRLFRAFRLEQSEPATFYQALAADSTAQLGEYVDLDGTTVLDVGGGPGYFRDAFRARGSTYFALDADVGELSGLGDIASGTVIGSGMQLPFADGSIDVCYSSNVLEHVSDPWLMADEMVRVTRPGGVTFVSYTVWYGPWGGHETAPWHFLGGRYARARYRRTHGREPKNRFGESLFPVTVKAGLDWAREQTECEVLAVVPRYHPRFAHWLLRVPVVRELVTWNLAIVLQRR